MSKINVLSPEVAQLIAAGEVVERPGSAVKEMVENAIDAGATAVTVEIRNGGNTFVRISDNGCGISREDCPAAFMPHATSKISCGEDLYSISTLGFRGEALASIAAVAKVEMLTKTADEETGTRIVIHGGEIIDIDDAGCPTGTVITVRDFFFNTPARRKFLKKDMTEAANIGQIMDRLALSHPEISFTLRRENGDALYTPGDGKLMSAVSAVLGRETASGMEEVDVSAGSVRVSGCICRPVNARPNRNMQIFFLNGRFVRSKTFAAALEQAYKNSIAAGKFPACVLNVSAPFDFADVNVHPAKLEVRFADEQMMFRAVYHAVKQTLESPKSPAQAVIDGSVAARPGNFEDDRQHVQGRLNTGPVVRGVHAAAVPFPKSGMPDVDISAADGVFARVKRESRAVDSSEHCAPPAKGTVQEMRAPLNYRSDSVEKPHGEDAGLSAPYTPGNERTPEERAETVEDSGAAAETSPEEENRAEDIAPYKYIGEAFDTYIIAQRGDSLFFVDKHALHERILYDELKSNIKGFSQPLLTPLPVTLTKEEYAAVLDNAETLSAAGFDVDDFGPGTVLVRAMPMYYETADVESSITEIAGKLVNSPECDPADRVEWIFRSVACRGAIKAGAVSSPEELMRLLGKIDSVRYCPHGRPVTLELTRRKLEKEFHRQ